MEPEMALFNWYWNFHICIFCTCKNISIVSMLKTLLKQMQAEFQVLSPLVPLRQVKFLRYCKKLEEGLWAVVDLSIDSIHEGSNAFSPFSLCRRLPSGCLIQEMPNGYSKVINNIAFPWILFFVLEHNVLVASLQSVGSLRSWLNCTM